MSDTGAPLNLPYVEAGTLTPDVPLRDLADAINDNAVVYAGDWDDSTEYAKGHLVIYENALYRAKETNTNKQPDTNTAQWDKWLDGSVAPAGDAGAGYGGTSTTSLAIETGSKAFTTQTGLAYVAGSRARAISGADSDNWMEGDVASYSGTTLTLTVDATGGSGTFADWSFTITGEKGADGTSLELGETSSTAYRGDRGKTAYDHSQLTSGNPHNVSLSDLSITATSTELNYVDGVTSALQAQLDDKVGSTETQTANTVFAGPSSGADAAPAFRGIVTADLPSGIDAGNLADGSISNTEFQYLNGVTSNIQDQIGDKADDDSVVKLTGAQTVAGVKTFSNSPVVPAPTADMQAATKKYVDDNIGSGGASDLDDLSDVVLTSPSSGQILTFNGTYWVNDDAGGGVALGETSSTAYRGDRGKIAYDHSQLTSGNPHNVSLSDLSITASATELNYVDGVTGAIQTQLDAKAADSEVVKLTGDQTIAGVKTLSSFPVTPSSAPSSDYEVANKKYVDDNAGGTRYFKMSFFATTAPGASEVLMIVVADEAFTIPADFTNSQFAVGTPPGDTYVLSVKQNGTEVGTISIADDGAVTAATTDDDPVSVSVGDVITVIGAGIADESIANIAGMIRGTI